MTKSSKILFQAERIIPWVLPLLLLFSRALADLTLVLIGLLFLYKSYLDCNWQWSSQPWFKLCLVYFCYLLFVNTPLSINVTDSLSGSFSFMRWPIFAAALAYWLFNDAGRQRHFIISLLVISLFIIFDTWWQYFTREDLFGIAAFSENRLTGPFRSPVPGTLMLRVVFILLFAGLLIQPLKRQRNNLLYIFSIVILSLTFIFITGERMAFLLYSLGTLLVLTGLFFHYPHARHSVLTGLLIIVMLIISIMYFNPEATDRIVSSSIDKLSHFADSDYGIVFKAALKAWQTSPLFGSGIGSYQEYCQQLGILSEISSQAGFTMKCSHPHNLYLEIATETGAIGLALFSILLLAIFHAALMPLIRAKNWYALSVSAAILCASFWPFTGGISVLSNWIAALVWLGVGWVLAMAQLSTSSSLAKIYSSTVSADSSERSSTSIA